MIHWLLDTDHLTILERGGSTALPLQIRLGELPANEFGTTIISYEEQMCGWLAHVSKAKTPQKTVEAYALLQDHIETFRDAPILAYGDLAATEFERLRQARIGIGTSDLRIAAICLARDATLLTRNLRDFNRIPGLRAEDWSV